MKTKTRNWMAVLLGLIGAASLTLSINCSVDVDVTPNEDRHGWAGPEVLAKSQDLVAEMPKFELVGQAAVDPVKRDVRLWQYALEINDGEHLPNTAQQIGDCVSWGASNAVNYLQAVQIARDWENHRYRRSYPPYIYGTSRVQIGGGRINGDGSLGVWAAKAVQQYGVLAADGDDVPKYSGQVAREWGRRGPPEKFIDQAREFLVKTTAQVRSAQDACEAIVNGYPVTIASNFGTRTIRKADGRQVAKWDGSWAHQMCLIAYDGTASSGERYFYCINSWGDRAHPAPLQGEPPGGFWIRWSDVNRITQSGDCWAFSSFTGFPAQELDFRILATKFPKPNAKWFFFVYYREELVMVGMLFGCGCVCLALAIYLTGRGGRGRALRLAVLLGLMLAPLSVQAEALDFRILETETTPMEDLDFSMIAMVDDCPCPDGECKCDPDECVCPDCPVHKTKDDKRPVIRVYTRPNCQPCIDCKKDSKKLSKSYRFEFVEKPLASGNPKLEWETKSGKTGFTGWLGVDVFRQLYDNTTKQRASKIDVKPLPISSSSSTAVTMGGNCSNGVCKTLFVPASKPACRGCH